MQNSMRSSVTLKLKLTLTLTLTLTDTGGAVLTLMLGYRPGGELPWQTRRGLTVTVSVQIKFHNHTWRFRVTRQPGSNFILMQLYNDLTEAACTWAMPDPIKPPPITVTRWTADLHDDVDIDLTCKLAQVLIIVKQQSYNWNYINCWNLRSKVKGQRSVVYRGRIIECYFRQIAQQNAIIHAQNVQSVVVYYLYYNKQVDK